MELFSKEVRDMKELKDVLKNRSDILEGYKVAVIVYAFDRDNKIIFQRRGLGCRDERLKLETIGGKVQENDIDFRSALNREIVEEVGIGANVKINEFVTATYVKTFDERYNKEQSWIYLVYKGDLISGDLQIAEPDKSLGYERYKIGEVNENELSNGAKELYRIVSKKYSYLS